VSGRVINTVRAAIGPSAALLASAAVLCGLILVQLGRVPEKLENRAMARMMTMGDVVSRVGDFTMLSFNAGSDDVLAVLDGRGEELYFYRVRNQRELEFLGREDLKGVFATGRRIGPGRK